MFDPSSKDNRNRSLLSWGGVKAASANESLAQAASRTQPGTETISVGEAPAPDASHVLADRTEARRAEHFDARLRETPPPAARLAEAHDDPYWRPMIDPMYVFRAIAGSKRLILIATLVGALAGVLIALATPKEYYASTQILFDPRSLQLSDQDLTADNLPSDATLALIENQVGIIQSTTVLDRVVEELDLAEDPEFNGGGGGILGVLMNPRALLSFGGGGAGSEDRPTAIAIQNLAEKLEVFRSERTFIIHIGALTQDADKSALIANTTAEIYLAQTGALLRQTADRATSELTDQLDELKAAVEEAERAVVDYRADHDIVGAQGRLISDDEIVRLSAQLSTARARTAELNARAATANDLDVDSVLGGALPEQVSSPVMTELLAQYSRLQQEADRAAVRLGPRHPDNLTLAAELGGVREAMAGELRRVNASMQVELRRAVELEQDLAARLARLKAQNANREGEYVTLRELEREAEARRTVYESFLLRARQTGQQRSLNTANASIISTAHPPLVPTGPSRTSIAIVGTILGFLAGIGIAAGRGAFESLRENMPGRRSEVPGSSQASYRSTYRRDDEEFSGEEDEFDPPPQGPGGGGRARYREPTGAVDGLRGSALETPAREHPAAAGSTRYVSMFPANDVLPSVHDVAGETSPVDRICDSLRAFRREVDDLAAQRARRRA